MNLQEKKLIETEALGFNYPDGVNALDGINIHIKKGEFVGILGANGSGKTTLLRLLNGLLKPRKGIFRTKGRQGYKQGYVIQ